MIGFIVSVYDRPDMLNVCLASLAVQPEPKIIVCNNSENDGVTAKVREIVSRYGGVHAWTGTAYGAGTCYESANIVAKDYLRDEQWLCFPSDDSYYVEDFSKIMLQTADTEKADLVYCDCVYRSGKTGNQQWPAYSVLNVSPRMGRIDKTCFIVRRDKFKGFPAHTREYRDGALIESLMAEGIRHAKAPGVLVVHQ